MNNGKRTILLADDLVEMLDIIKEAISEGLKEDFHFLMATTAEDVVKLAKENKVDLIVTNYKFNTVYEKEKPSAEFIFQALEEMKIDTPCLLFTGYPFSLNHFEKYKNLRAIVDKSGHKDLLKAVEVIINGANIKRAVRFC